MIKGTLAIILAATLLTGCVISIDDDGFEYGNDNHTSWSDIEESNRAKIGQLSIGTSIDSVRRKMGVADFDELLVKNGEEHRILFYRTQRVKGDGSTTKDECTPLVFVNGELSGFGQVALDAI